VAAAIITSLYYIKPTIVQNAFAFIVIPLQKGASVTAKFFGDKIAFYSNINKIENENYELKKEIESLKETKARLENEAKDYEILTDLYNLDNRYPEHEKVGAYVISKDASPWYSIFLIDKGEKDGLQRNMPVMADGGLVGKIIEAGANYSKVISIIDDSSAAAVSSLRANYSGTMRGYSQYKESGLCIMENIDKNAAINIGDEIATSHLSKIYPPGITVGVVREIGDDANGNSKFAIIEPAVDFTNLQIVLVINTVFEKDSEGLLKLEDN
jgi:rod shape-determining protein MreC